MCPGFLKNTKTHQPPSKGKSMEKFPGYQLIFIIGLWACVLAPVYLFLKLMQRILNPQKTVKFYSSAELMPNRDHDLLYTKAERKMDELVEMQRQTWYKEFFKNDR